LSLKARKRKGEKLTTLTFGNYGIFKRDISIISREYVIIDQYGMHARPATALLKLGRVFKEVLLDAAAALRIKNKIH
jgi:hypothetical protein